MKVWTLVTPAIFDTLQAGDTYRGEQFLTPVLDFSINSICYPWLVGHMEQQIGFPKSIYSFPIWGFQLYCGENKIPRNYDFDFFPKEASVCLTLEIPRHEVVLSDSLMWESIALGEYIPKGNTLEEVSKNYEDYKNADLVKQAFLRVLSWHEVFNTANSQYVYAHFWEIRPEMIREVMFLS